MVMLLQRLQEIFHDPAYMKGVTNYFDLDVPFLMKSPLPLRKCLHIPVTFNYVSHIMRNLFLPYANNKGSDQPAHPCSLISTLLFAA